MPADTAAQLEALAGAVARLRPDWRSAAQFYEARSEITAALRTLAQSPLMTQRVVRFVTMPAPASLPPPADPAALPTRLSRATGLHARPRRGTRHRYPHPGRGVPGQTLLGLDSPQH
jgi:hypothetical protein